MAFFPFHSVGWWLLLCCFQIWIGCQANFTDPPSSNVSDANVNSSTTLPSLEDDPSHLTTFYLPPSPLKPSALDTLRSLVKVDSTENLPQEENDVLSPGEHDKAFDEVDIDKSHDEKCVHGSHDCFPPSTEEPTSSTVAVTTENNSKKEKTTGVWSPSNADETPSNEVFTRYFTLPPSNSSDVLVTNSSGSLQDEPTPAPTSENIIPVESPLGDRKDAVVVPSDAKEPTAPLSHDEKSQAKHVGAPGHRQRGEADHQQQPKAFTVPDEKDPGPPDESHNVHHVPSSEFQGGIGNDNVVNSEVIVTKPVAEVQPTPPKDPPKEVVKYPDDPKKQDQQPTKEEQNLSSTEPFSRSTSTTTSVGYPSFNATESLTSSVTSTASETTNATESTLPITTPTTGASPTQEIETKRTTGSTTTTASTSPSLPVQPIWITNTTCSDLPVCVKVRVSGSVCESETNSFVEESLKAAVVDVLHRHLRDVIHPGRVVVRAECDDEESHHRQATTSDSLLFFVTDISGEYEEDLTSIAGVLLRRLVKKSKGRNSAQTQIISARLVERGSDDLEESGNALKGEDGKATNTPSAPFVVTHNSGMIAAVAISAVAGACLCLLCLLMVVMKQRLAAQQHQVQNVNGHHRPPNGQLDAYSLDSFSINASFRRRRPGRSSVGSFTNHGFVGDHDDMALLSKRMSSAALAALLKNHKTIIEEEFQKIPMNMPKPREIPVGAEVKNRYVNVVPNPKTRVFLADNTDDPVRTYINANYVRGYDNRPSFYIACQAPLTEYVEDFWKMIWEQQSRVILMLTMLEENGIRRCAPYFPESTLDCRQLHGDYQITLLKKDIREFYTLSVFKLYCIEKNLFREVRHFWFTTWPAVGVPKDPMSLVTYLLQARPFTNCNSGPTVVHCSAGTGRTGTVIALDRCMREYEESRTMDIVQCVAQIRRDRGGAVQNKQQYLLIHEAMMEYASYTANQSNRASIQSNQLEDEAPSSLLKRS